MPAYRHEVEEAREEGVRFQWRAAEVLRGGDAVNGGDSVVEAVRGAKRAAKAIDEWQRCTS